MPSTGNWHQLQCTIYCKGLNNIFLQKMYVQTPYMSSSIKAKRKNGPNAADNVFFIVGSVERTRSCAQYEGEEFSGGYRDSFGEIRSRYT